VSFVLLANTDAKAAYIELSFLYPARDCSKKASACTQPVLTNSVLAKSVLTIPVVTPIEENIGAAEQCYPVGGRIIRFRENSYSDFVNEETGQ
jgi:hypothetical protein